MTEKEAETMIFNKYSELMTQYIR